MPRGGPSRGHKSGHKGQKRHFTNPDDLVAQKEKEAREKQWKQRQGEMPTDSESEGSEKSSESQSSDEEVEEARKAKGVESLIEVENPNRAVQKTKKVSQLETVDVSKPAELSRREREEIERQQARANYLKMHAAGKTEEARADLARLALIKKQREDAAKRKEEDKKAKDALKSAKTENIQKALGKKTT